MFQINYLEKFIAMREVGKWTTQCLDELQDFIKPGITTKEVDRFVRDFGNNNLLENADYGYKGFPAYCCTSLNEVMCHGIPDDRIIECGVLKVDVTFRLHGYHGDACRTYLVGDVPKAARDFVEVARNCKVIGCQQCGPGNTIGNIGRAIEIYARLNNVFIARDFIGHGIGLKFHDSPGISHVDDPDDIYYEMKMEPGMTFTIEPIVMLGSSRYRSMRDGWGVRHKERLLTAQWEATLGITEDGYEVFCE